MPTTIVASVHSHRTRWASAVLSPPRPFAAEARCEGTRVSNATAARNSRRLFFPRLTQTVCYCRPRALLPESKMPGMVPFFHFFVRRFLDLTNVRPRGTRNHKHWDLIVESTFHWNVETLPLCGRCSHKHPSGQILFPWPAGANGQDVKASRGSGLSLCRFLVSLSRAEAHWERTAGGADGGGETPSVKQLQ